MSIVNTNNKQCRVSFEESIISSLPEFQEQTLTHSHRQGIEACSTP